jgi:hypothetical protein
MDVIGNNTANVNTAGLKSGQVNFQDILAGGGTIPSGTTSPLGGLSEDAASQPSASLPSDYSLLPAGGATAGLTGVSPCLGTPAWQSPMVGTSANPPDLRAPSSDTNGLLNQYLYVYNNWGSGKLPADTCPIFNDLANVKSEIVQLMGSTLMSGPSYTGGMGYAISSADVKTAQKLAAETNSQWNYNPDLLNALGRGLAGYPVNGPILGATTGSYGASFGITGGAPGSVISTGATTADATGATTADASASRIAALEASIAHETQRVATQTAKGNHITAALDKASLDKYKKQLAALTA